MLATWFRSNSTSRPSIATANVSGVNRRSRAVVVRPSSLTTVMVRPAPSPLKSSALLGAGCADATDIVPTLISNASQTERIMEFLPEVTRTTGESGRQLPAPWVVRAPLPRCPEDRVRNCELPDSLVSGWRLYPGPLPRRRPRFGGGGDDVRAAASPSGQGLRLRPERFDEAFPMFEHGRGLPVNLEPRQRVLERTAMHQGALGARRHLEIGDARLQRQELAQPLGIAAGNRQQADLQDGFLRRPPEFGFARGISSLPGSGCLRVLRRLLRVLGRFFPVEA